MSYETEALQKTVKLLSDRVDELQKEMEVRKKLEVVYDDCLGDVNTRLSEVKTNAMIAESQAKGAKDTLQALLDYLKLTMYDEPAKRVVRKRKNNLW